MPEVLTKYPDTFIKVVSGGQGVNCGPGQAQRILKDCPPEQFCSTPNGETCVFGLDEIGEMTQISKSELAAKVCANEAASGACTVDAGQPAGMDLTAVGAALVLGVALGRLARRR